MRAAGEPLERCPYDGNSARCLRASVPQSEPGYWARESCSSYSSRWQLATNRRASSRRIPAAESQRDRAPLPRRRRAESATPASWERPASSAVSPRFACCDHCTAECQQGVTFLIVRRLRDRGGWTQRDTVAYGGRSSRHRATISEIRRWIYAIVADPLVFPRTPFPGSLAR